MMRATKTLPETLASLLPESAELVQFIITNGAEEFNQHGKVPVGLFYRQIGGRVMVHDIEVLTPEIKPMVWQIVAMVRQMHPIVAFVSEVWMAMCEPGDVNPDQTVKVMPSQHPKRQEKVLISLWEKDRVVAFYADIQRNPDKLGEWAVMHDSQETDGEINRLGGGMMQGPGYQVAKDN